MRSPSAFCATASTAVVLLTSVVLVNADTSLWIPAVDPQPISAGVLGVGSDGRTTWQLQQGSATGTFTDPSDDGFPFTATMVQGPSDAVLSAVMEIVPGDTATVVVSCAINTANGLAVCGDVVSDGSTTSTDTEVDTETFSPMLVQGGGSVSGAATSGSGTTTGASQPQSTGSNQASAGSSPTSSGASPTGSASGKNSAGKHQIAGGLFGLACVAGSVVNYVL